MKTNLFKFFKKENNDVKDSEILLEKKKYDYDKNNLQGVLVDTNFLLNNTKDLENIENPFFSSYVLREIEHLELTRKQDKNLQAQIRGAKRYLETVESRYIDINDYKYDLDENLDGEYVDNLLVQIALANNLSVATNDRLLKEKCKAFGIVLEEVTGTDQFDDFKGFIEIKMSQDTLNRIYNNLEDNSFGLLINEYLIARDTKEEVIDIFKWTGDYMQSLRNSRTGKLNNSFTTSDLGYFSPKDAYQHIAVDSIRSNMLTVIRGRAGSGKTLIGLNTAWDLVEREGYKLYIFVNPVPSKDAQELGFYKGDKNEKLMQTSVGNMLKSKFGGSEHDVLNHIMADELEILPFADLRGFDTGEKSIIYISEAQNLTSELLKLALQRVAEGSKVIIDGDYHLQLDSDVYEYDNGMKRASEVFRGTDLYAEIELQKVWRSRLADMAEKM